MIKYLIEHVSDPLIGASFTVSQLVDSEVVMSLYDGNEQMKS